MTDTSLDALAAQIADEAGLIRINPGQPALDLIVLVELADGTRWGMEPPRLTIPTITH